MFKNLCKSLFICQSLIYRSIFGFVKKFMDENSITVPSKCTKVMANNIWPEREKQVIIEQCTEIPVLVMELLVPLSL